MNIDERMVDIHSQIACFYRRFPKGAAYLHSVRDMTCSDTFWESMREHNKTRDEVYVLLQRSIDYSIKRALDQDLEYQRFLKKLEKVKPQDYKWLFITVIYDKDKITDNGVENIDLIKRLSTKVRDLPHWKSVIGCVNEKHRENGITYHTHYLFETDVYKAKAVQYVYQAVKKFVIGQASVDVKGPKDRTAFETYKKYVAGEKRTEKLPFVKMDEEWRRQNNFEF